MDLTRGIQRLNYVLYAPFPASILLGAYCYRPVT